MEMRKLTGEDLFPLMNILAKVGVKEALMKFFKQRSEAAKKDKEEVNVEEIGMEAIAEITEIIFMNMERAKQEINVLLADLCEVKREDIEKLPMSDYVAMVMDFLSQQEFRASMNAIMLSFK